MLLSLVLLGANAFNNSTSLDAPPPGIMPATISLAQVRAMHEHAIAGSLPDDYRIHETLKAEGLDGSIDKIARGDDYRIDETLGPVHSAFGTYKGRRWEQNGSGQIVTITGIHRRNDVDGAAEAYLKPGATLLGEVTSPVHAYVVRLDPPGGRLEYVFYDVATGRIDRIEDILAGSRDTEEYEQFAAVGTRSIPWHVHTIAGTTGEERDVHLASVDTSTPVTDSDVEPPAAVNPLTFPSSPYAIPAQVLSDRIIVRTSINRHPVDLQLDSGSSGILIDKSVLDAVGVHTYGTGRAVTAGLYDIGHAIVPRIDIGNAALKNVYVEAAPFSEVAENHTVIAGLIGFDFIDAAVVKIDYASGTVSLIDPSTFAAPPNAVAVPIALDDLVPSIGVTIAGANAPHMILDTGADRSALFSQFTQANPESTKDQGLGTREMDAHPFDLRFMGVGGKVSFRQLQLGPFAVAGVTFPTWLFGATQDAASFEDEDIDGLVGQDVLRYFDVYLDYPHERIYFVPNQRYRDRFS